MSITVDQTWVYRFHDMLMLTYQQKGSLLQNKLDPGMIHRDVNAHVDFHERLGLLMANDVVNPFGPTVILNPEHSRRAVRMISSDAAVLVSDEHSLRAMVNPQNGYTNTIVYAMGRRVDKHIIDAVLGTAETASVGEGTGTITFGTQALPSGNVIGSGIAITLANIIAANEKLSKGGIPTGPGERKFLYSAGQLRDILGITQASSSDFTKNQIHDRGTIDGVTWEGFEWIEIQDVVNAAGTVQQNMLPLASTTRSCIAFAKSAVGLSIGRPAGAPQINQRPDLQSNPIQVRQAMMMAAVRVWEAGVIKVDVLEN